MKTTKFLVVAFAALFMGTTAIKAQTEAKIEVPNWCVKQAVEYVNKIKVDVKIEPADSVILVEEYALRLTKNSIVYKTAKTDEEKMASAGIISKEYMARIKERISSKLYFQVMKWHIDQSKKK
jgi:hypothetical protein